MEECPDCKGLRRQEKPTTEHIPSRVESHIPSYDRGRKDTLPKKVAYTSNLGHGSVERRMYDLYKTESS